MQSITTAVPLFPKNPELWVLYGETAWKNGNKTEAFKAFDKASQLNSKSPEAYRRATNMALGNGDYEAAKRIVGKWEKALGENAETLFYKAKIYGAMKKYRKAIGYANKALKKDRNNINTYRILATLYTLNDQDNKAIETLEKLLDRSPHSVDVMGMLGELYFKQKNYAKALKYYNQIYGAHYSHIQIGMRLLADLVKGDRYKDSIRFINALTENEKDHQEMLRVLKAALLQKLGHHAEARNIELGMKNTSKEKLENAHVEAAGLLSGLKKEDLAIGVLKQGIAKKPDSALLHLLLARAYATQKSWGKAISAARVSCDLDPSADCLYYLGAYYERAGKWQEAADTLKKALEKNPDDPSVLNYLGYLLIDYDMNVKEGVSLVKKALKEKPDNGYYLDSLAWGYYKLGDLEKAKALQEKAVESAEESSLIYAHWGSILNRLGEKEKAKRVYQKALELMKKEKEDLNQWERSFILKGAKEAGLSPVD
jgi:tetratricopeptide (TPR) repeat protein